MSDNRRRSPRPSAFELEFFAGATDLVGDSVERAAKQQDGDDDANRRDDGRGEPMKAPSVRLSFRDVRMKLRALGYMLKRNECDEYIVKPLGARDDDESVTYHTNDLADALGTGREMWVRRCAL